MLSDVSTALRENERDAWRRLIRVMGHEINNTLGRFSRCPTRCSSSSRSPFERASFDTDLVDALRVISRRSEALGRFIASYGRLARLPPPKLAPVALGALIEKVALVERRVMPQVTPGPDVTLSADADQLEQALINLLKNAAEATTGRRTRTTTPAGVEIAIEDEGPGVGDTANLFVPFFTTKPEGSGIGLVLAREIVEAHKGQLTLASRTAGRGAVARIARRGRRTFLCHRRRPGAFLPVWTRSRWWTAFGAATWPRSDRVYAAHRARVLVLAAAVGPSTRRRISRRRPGSSSRGLRPAFAKTRGSLHSSSRSRGMHS